MKQEFSDTEKARQSRLIVRIDDSPMNPKVKVHQLECGHDVFLPRKSRKKYLLCERCAR